MNLTGKQMKITKTDIKQQIERLNQLLSKTEYLLSKSDRQKFKEEIQRLIDQVEKIGEPVLNIGLLGGTGVGKSTIINALADAQISSVSDRRPHTDLVVVYRHKEVTLPPQIPLEYVKEPHQVHDHDSIASLIIYDFPDFDSIRSDHADNVLKLVEFLDIAVWVVSPEKYADLEFYRFIANTSKHQDNFIFVMNKIDTIKDPNNDPQNKLKTLLGDFALKLKKNGILSPRIYSFSAREIHNKGVPEWWKEDFYIFKESLFKKRHAKEIIAIKEANIEVEIRKSVREFKKLYQKFVYLPVEIDSILMDFQKQFQELKSSSTAITKQFITDKTISALKEKIHEKDADSLPISFFNRIWRKTIGRPSSLGEASGLESTITPDDQRFEPIRNKFKTLLYRINAVLHRYGIDVANERLSDLEKLINQELNQFVNESREGFLEFLEAVPSSFGKLRGFLNRANQWFWLAIPGIFLAISLAGPETLKDFQNNPGPGKVASVIFNIILSLYTPSGLIALLSFLVIELLITVILASRSAKRENEKLQEQIEAFNKYLAQKLTKHLENLKQKIDKTTGEIAKETINMKKLLEELESIDA